MTTPTPRSGGRTSQGRGPAPDRHEPGRILGGASSPGRTRTARPASQGSPARTPSFTYRQKRGRPRKQARVPAPVTTANRSVKAAAVGQPTDSQKIIAAEFVLAELLIALTPMTSRSNPNGLSPYAPRDMTKMLAVGAVFFLLELLAIPAGWGRLMAWLGGLLLLTVGLNEAANVARDIDAFAGIKTAAKKVTGG